VSAADAALFSALVRRAASFFHARFIACLNNTIFIREKHAFTMIRNAIRGVIPPMITPFDENGEVDYEAHRANVERWNAYELGGLLALGSNSEAALLDEAEKLALIRATAEVAAPGRWLLAGTGMESTRQTIRLSNLAAEAGAHAVLVLTPSYYRDQVDEAAIIAHFEQVADAVVAPVLIYNVPKFTGVNISARVVETLSAHPNIVGMKDSAGNLAQLVAFQRVASHDFRILVGTASLWYPALTLGIEGGIMALANCAPAECVAVRRLFCEDRWEEAEFEYRRLAPVNEAVTATFGVAGLKYACTLRGYQGGRVRAPLTELPESRKTHLRAMLEAEKLI
jgi:4-hydroxy-2-oxoglutarate aldolase